MISNDVIHEKLKGFEKLINEKFKRNDEDHDDLKSILEKKANKWSEYVLKFFMGAMGLWIINEILDMIPKTYAIYNYYL